MKSLDPILDSSRWYQARPVVNLLSTIILLLSLSHSAHAQLIPRTYQPTASSFSSLSASGGSGGHLNQTWRMSVNNSKFSKLAGNFTSTEVPASLSKSVLGNESVTSKSSWHHYIVGCGNNRFNGDQGKEAFADFSKFCYLWNSSCSSHSTLGLQNIQTILALSYYNPCFGGGCQCMVDGTPAPAASTSSLASLVEFLRSPQCPVIFNGTSNCCGRYDPIGCHFGLTAVDLYYWPVADSDTSCLGVIGNDTTPLGQGATTLERPYMQSSMVYWVSTDVCRLDEAPWTTTQAVVYARLTTLSGLTFKFYSTNPWDNNESCMPLSSLGSGATTPKSGGLTPIQTRKQSLMAASLTNDAGESNVNVVTLDGSTLYV